MQERYVCEMSGKPFILSEDEQAFYEKMNLPVPRFCPKCRQQRRILYRNFKTLYKRPSDKTGQSMISMYHQDAPFPVWSHDEWWADDWSALDYGRDFDFSRPLFEQIKELWDVVPRYAVMNSMSANCTYSNMTGQSKNCYLVFGCMNDEDCNYGHIVWECKDCHDGLYVYKSEMCYECVDVLGSYRCHYCQECEDCADSVGLYDCHGCTNCIGCVGLRKQSYHIFNQPVTKETYKEFLEQYPLHDPATIQFIREQQMTLRQQLPNRHFFGTHNDNVSGNHIYNARNLHHGFDVKGGENSRYAFTTRNTVETYDASFSPDVEFCYQILFGGGQRIFSSHNCVNCTDTYYSNDCSGSRNIFACAGLKSAEYCILNKQYTKEEYEELFPRLMTHVQQTGEWGEFFPIEICPFSYNESIVNEYMPLSKEEALALGFTWKDDIPMTTGQETITHDQLPLNPEEYSADLTQQVLVCTDCARNYRLIDSEIQFLKRMGLGLPHKCFNCRHQDRMDIRNPRELWPGSCDRCQIDFETSYPPETQDQLSIYCGDCYRETMV